LKHKEYLGIIPPLVTPLKDYKTIDISGTERLIEHVLAGGVHGLFILGTSGEGPSLSYKLRYEFTEKACRQIDGRVPVLVGITDTSIIESLSLAKKAADVGADAVVATPPYYFSNSQPELIRYFSHLADNSPLPLFLYNMPSHTKTKILPETVKELSIHPNIIGLKDSSGDLNYLQMVLQLIDNTLNFPLLVGPEELLMQAMLSGSSGGVNGGANMFPKLYVEMYEAATQKDFERMSKLQKRILTISRSFYSIGNSPMSYLQGVKCVLSVMGICSGELAIPSQKLDESDRQLVEQRLLELNLL
jgi:4-hydroxy-tetrahydrodipicolinate synthase